MKNVAIVHYNTPELTAATIRSLWKHTPDAVVTVFDNSDRHRFRAMDGVRILDNTTGRLVDFAAMLGRYPEKMPTACNWGSEKHIASVDYLFDILPDGFVLMDSDVLVKRDITPFFDGWLCGLVLRVHSHINIRAVVRPVRFREPSRRQDL